MNIISIHSRKGGAGKTSIALSIGMQLAILGKKVALVEMDTFGSHWGQSLPLYRDVKKNEFDEYENRPYIIWSLINNSSNKSNDTVESLIQRASCKLIFSNQTRRLQKIKKNLFLYPLPNYLDPLNRVEQLLFNHSGQINFIRFLSRLIESFTKEKFDFVIFDQSAGLSFISGLNLKWTLDLAYSLANTRDKKVHCWFVVGPSYYEQSLLNYEINAYSSTIKNVNPLILINNIKGDKWLNIPCGSIINTKDVNEENKQILAKRFYGLPIWRHKNMLECFDKYMIEPNIKIGIIGHDKIIENSFQYNDISLTWEDLSQNWLKNFVHQSVFHKQVKNLINSILV